MNRDEIVQVYAQGVESVRAVIESLQQQVVTLQARVTDLERRLNQDSHNSHQPPSRDQTRPRPQPKSLRRKSGKRPGGQAGHEGHTRSLSEQPDQVLTHAPTVCTQCQQDLCSVSATGYDRRQVRELPALRVQVIEHRALHKTCPQCQQVTVGVFPPTVSQPVQYGAQFKGLAVYLQTYQLLPFERTHELLLDCFGDSPCNDSVGEWLQVASQQLQPFEKRLTQTLARQAVLHSDETSMRVQGQRHWVHSTSTTTLSHYAVQSQRGVTALNTIGILPKFQGVLMHDAYPSYFSYACMHALCNAHLLRELVAVHEQTGQAWAAQFQQLLRDAKHAVAEARAQGQQAFSPAQRGSWTRRYLRLVRQGLQANPAAPPSGQRGRTAQSPARNLLLRLEKYPMAVLRFVHDFRVPFDNNQAERDIRMLKVKQKISGTFRSVTGAEQFCRLRSYVATLHKQDLPLLAGLQSLFVGQPLLPRFH